MMNSAKRVRRLLTLTEYLQSGRAFPAGALAEFCGVTRRTIFRDLALLREAGLTVVNDPARGGFSLAGPALLPSTELTLAEALALLVLCGGLEDGERGISEPFAETSRSAARKLLSRLPGRIRDEVGELTGRVTIRDTQLAPADDSADAYAAVEEAMRSGTRLRVTYDSVSEGEVIRTLLSPYRLLFMRRAWYVVARSSLHTEVRTFHLGRFVTTEPTKTRFAVPKRFTLARYFGDAWAFIREPDARHDVAVRFTPKVARNVAGVTWHRKQKLEWPGDGSLVFKTTVEGLNEIVWWVLGYGAEAEVLEPPELREMVADHVRRMGERYGPS